MCVRESVRENMMKLSLLHVLLNESKTFVSQSALSDLLFEKAKKKSTIISFSENSAIRTITQNIYKNNVSLVSEKYWLLTL